MQVNKEITTVFFSLFSDESIVLPTIVVGTLVIVFGLPFFSVANVSLYSKITDEKTQGKSSNTEQPTDYRLLDIKLLLVKKEVTSLNL